MVGVRPGRETVCQRTPRSVSCAGKGGPAKRMNYSSSALIATYTTNVTIRSRAVTATRALMFCSASARTLRSEAGARSGADRLH